MRNTDSIRVPVKEGRLQLHSAQSPDKAQRNAECLVQQKGKRDPALRSHLQHTMVLRWPSSSLPFPTRCGQRPEFLIARMFCPGHPPGWSSVPAYPFGRNPSISLLVYVLVFFLALSCRQLLSLRCFLPFSAYVHTSIVSYL